MATATRLPGIQFEVVAPAAQLALPRMDIAVFVGFAASGPISVPVAVEDIQQFQEIFGADLALAQDGPAGQTTYAYLAPAVRAFLRNGGRRCWVVRVAGESAVSNVFQIPGLSVLDKGGITQAKARARSEGSWSDGLTVGASRNNEPVVVAAFNGSPFGLSLVLSKPAQVGTGDLLHITFPDRPPLWFFVDTVTPGISSPTAGFAGQLVDVTAERIWWESSDSSPTLTRPLCEIVTMDLFVQGGPGELWMIPDLGFAPKHPRYWGLLPDDSSLYAIDNPDAFGAEAAHPRFPLAGPKDAQGLYLPLGLGSLPAKFLSAESTTADALVRDGVAEFDSSLFLDPALSDTLTTDLQNEADFIRYQSSSTRDLTGIHAAFSIDEATIIAVPDAVGRGWTRSDPGFLASPPFSPPLFHPEWWPSLECSGQTIPRTAVPPPGQFLPSNLEIIPAPPLAAAKEAGGKITLTWTPQAGYSDILEEAADPAFLTAQVSYQGASGKVVLFRPSGDYYYRLRRTHGKISSDYSPGIAVRIDPASQWLLNTPAVYRNDTLLDVHRALLRLCTARGDLFAVLAMPGHYRERDALAHVAQLKSGDTMGALAPPIGAGEANCFSYGAIYHPWIAGREENDLTHVRTNPPDGAAAGILALRAYNRGAWIAPANELFRGVAAVDPPVNSAYWLDFQDAQINLLRQDPAGFHCLAASTLSDDPDLEPINVRRLLSLLRKTAIRVGNRYVFEPNNAEFRRGIERGFEDMLDGMFLQGAFAGRTSRQAFDVIADDSLNTPREMDQGRFYVILKVAPSVPLRFLTIRLVQTADRTSVTEGK